VSNHRADYNALRVVRGGLLGVSSGALAVTAHALGDGGLPDASLTIVLTALIGWVAAALATKTKGLPGILVVLGVGQLVMHLVLTVLMTHSEHEAAAPIVVHGDKMTAAHVSATVVTALLVTRAEALLRVAAGVMRMLLPVVWLPVPVPAAAPKPPLLFPAGASDLAGVLIRRVHGRRGPPAYS
jgi:uncharacterized membrane protein YeaQ/YmgE (transglycosylase-associated protein family)